MALTLTTLQTELQRRGFDYLTTTAQTYFLNRAMRDINQAEEWPWLEATATGAAPLTISDLSTIESVYDSIQKIKLVPLDRRNISDDFPDLTTTGSPSMYYLTTASVVNVYPVATNNLSVRYWKIAPELSSGSDAPLIPSTSNQLAIVDGAVGYAYEDSDNFDAAQQAFSQRDATIESMRETYLNWNRDRPTEFVVITDSESPVVW